MKPCFDLSSKSPIFVSFAATAFFFSTVGAQYAIGTGEAADLYQQHCMVCHGGELEGGLGSSLVDGKWIYGGSHLEIAQTIKGGLPDAGMEGFGSTLSAEQIRSLVIYVQEVAQMAALESLEEELRPASGVYQTEHHRFRLEALTEIEGVPWSLAFLPDGSMYVTERGGELYHFEAGVLNPVSGLPRVRARGQGGLMEVALHPNYSENGWVYLGYSHANHSGDGMTRVIRGKITDQRWGSEEVIYSAPKGSYISTTRHFGTRFVFKDGYLFFAIGDRGEKQDAQDLSKPNGKMHRVYDDGRVPEDNPFLGVEDALPTIWTYGHRNPQGMDLDPRTGELWSTEHGPRGGDETNLIKRGLNYGWPVITYGMNYNGTPITDKTEQAGMEQPAHFWTPSIAVCGIDFYEGDGFPAWKHDLLVSGMASQQLHRLVIEGSEVVSDEIILKNAGVIRDVESGPDGFIYLLLITDGQGRVCRLVPVD